MIQKTKVKGFMKYDCFQKYIHWKYFRIVPETDYCLLSVLSRFYDKILHKKNKRWILTPNDICFNSCSYV